MLNSLSFLLVIIFSLVSFSSHGWFIGRDNSMTKITPNPNGNSDQKIASSMATLTSGGATSMAVQVCPGVYLATAHGFFDVWNKSGRGYKKTARELKRSDRIYVDPFGAELKDGYVLGELSNVELFSPWIDNDNSSGNLTDFILIKLNTNRIYSKISLPLAGYDARTAVKKLKKSKSTFLFRNKPTYEEYIDSNGNFSIDFNRPLEHSTKAPRKVNSYCDLGENGNGYILTDCPAEEGVSGSILINKNKVIGIVKSVSPILTSKHIPVFSFMGDGDDSAAVGVIPTNSILKYRKRACGY